MRVRVALLVLAVYAAWVGAFLAAGNDVRDLVGFGKTYLDNGNFNLAFNHPDVKPIRAGGYEPRSETGYDGQFAYYLAARPEHAEAFMDAPYLRYSRALHPIAARVLALGDEDAIPWTLLLINWLAAGAGTFFLASWLQARGLSRWYALLFGLFPGIFVGVQRDLTEPLAYALVTLGLLLYDNPRRSRILAAGVAFGLAGLARQTTLLFPIVIGLWLSLAEGRRRDGLALLGLSVAPYLAYSIFLRVWLGSVDDAGNLTSIPFEGLFQGGWVGERQAVTLATVVVPALIALVVLLPRGEPFRSGAWLPWLLLLANFLLSVVFFANLGTNTYTSMGRLGTGMLLAAVMCLPYARGLPAQRRRWLAAAGVLAVLAPLPVVAVQGFTSLAG